MALSHIIWLAIIQGLTEFLPVSSSGHLTLLHAFTAYPDQGVGFDVALHFGTLIAVIIYFREDVASLLLGAMDFAQNRNSDNRHLLLQIIIASLPVLLVAAGLVLAGGIDMLRKAQTVALATIFFAVPLYLADKMGDQTGGLKNQSLRRAFYVGVAQIFSLIPGASRSGVTITAARALGVSRQEAVRFSMLLSIPVISCFSFFGLVELLFGDSETSLKAMLLGMTLSCFLAILSIHALMRVTAKMSFLPFVIYRLALGAVILMAI